MPLSPILVVLLSSACAEDTEQWRVAAFPQPCDSDSMCWVVSRDGDADELMNTLPEGVEWSLGSETLVELRPATVNSPRRVLRQQQTPVKAGEGVSWQVSAQRLSALGEELEIAQGYRVGCISQQLCDALASKDGEWFKLELGWYEGRLLIEAFSSVER
jgi:hypothetical protein